MFNKQQLVERIRAELYFRLTSFNMLNSVFQRLTSYDTLFNICWKAAATCIVYHSLQKNTAISKEEATSASAGFHTGPLSWWDLEMLVLYHVNTSDTRRFSRQRLGGTWTLTIESPDTELV